MAEQPGARTGGDPSVDEADALDALCDQRRAALPADTQAALATGRWGLALSGGGIRSATFCFGLLKSLAANRVFHRFDLLSTVSGGGYIGSTVGKLYHEASDGFGGDALAMERGLAQADTRWFAWWLRANGRYLIPRGAQDGLFAGAAFARNLLAIHIELALIWGLVGALLVGLDLAAWGWADCIFTGRACWGQGWVDAAVLGTMANWPTPWLLLPVAALLGGILCCTYWALPAQGARLDLQRWLSLAFWLAGAVLIVWQWDWLRGTMRARPLLLALALALLVCWIVGTLLAFVLAQADGGPDRQRNRLTTWLAHALKAMGVLVALGAVDALAWHLAVADGQQATTGGAIALAAVVLRALLPRIADLPRGLSPWTRQGIGTLVHLAGLLVLLALGVFWVSLVHRGATFALFDSPPAVQLEQAWRWWLMLSLPAAAMVALSWRHAEFLNRSSLHNFYRARLVRSYLGAANAQRFGLQGSAMGEVINARVAEVQAVNQVHAHDDVPMAAYAPQARGGPVHLLNMCVNQTRDPRGGLFNQDRKGLLMTVGPGGCLRVGNGGWRCVNGTPALSLGSWMAISGAAVAPGLGGATRSGIAALSMIAGIRLGWWWDSRPLRRPAEGRSPKPLFKYQQFVSELLARFEGCQRSHWYLSDGGHFENTAAYALLREGCRLIVVADCGADPRYAFGDLENLVRKARIDLQAEIRFLRPRDNPAGTPWASFGSLNDLASADSQACLALARVDYRRTGEVGHLVIVKPNMCEGAPVDLVNFKADNPLFPQEPTTDQFFGEAQWESYFRLGDTLGRSLTPALLSDIDQIAAAAFVTDEGSPVGEPATGAAATAKAPKRLPSRIAATGAVTASVSAGAVLTLALTAWQAVQSDRKAREDAQRLDRRAFKELADLYGKLPPLAAVPGSPGATDTRLGEMATTLLRVADSACNGGQVRDFRESGLLQEIVQSTRTACGQSPTPHPACKLLLDADFDPDRAGPCLQPVARASCEPQYWIRDYGGGPAARRNCVPEPLALVATGEPPPSSIPPGVTGAAPVVAPVVPVPPAASRPAPTPAAAAPSAGRPQRPAAAGAGAPVVAAPAAPAASAPTVPGTLACAGRTVYLQVYGPTRKDEAAGLRGPWQALGASVPAIEDVWLSSDRRGRTRPRPVEAPSLIVHRSGVPAQDAAAMACAQALASAAPRLDWAVRPLPANLRPTAGVIEAWLPPPAR